jgi:hypothetical protein
MPYKNDVKLEKSIMIDPVTAKQLEASGRILESDGYLDRFDGEKSMPIGGQKVVDAETAMKLAAQQGIALPSVGASVINTQQPIVEGKNMGVSKMPSAILNSFKEKPPMAPTAAPTEFNPEFLSKVKDANTRMNTVLGESNLPRHTMTEQTVPQVRSGNAQYTPAPTYAPAPAAAAIDYPFISMIVKESVKEALQGIDLKELVREVLKEEKNKGTAKAVNENIVIKLGDTVLGGHVTRLETPPAKK